MTEPAFRAHLQILSVPHSLNVAEGGPLRHPEGLFPEEAAASD